jgi:apolipoprotein D and lipocalin family protein
MRLNLLIIRSVLVTALLLAAACSYTPAGVQPIGGFDASRYMGRWYEVARLPNRFESGLEQITATYTLQDDGSVKVVNRGFDTQKNEWRDIEGKAKFVGSPDVATLKVSFFGPFYGGYNVVDLDPEYSHALVVGPNRSYLWILSREPQPPTEVVERLKRKATELGFDTQALVYVQH